jgi:hypothetical protein
MMTPEIEIQEPSVDSAKAPVHPKHSASSDRVADQRADALRAKKKKKRDAHQVALRRPHTGG